MRPHAGGAHLLRQINRKPKRILRCIDCAGSFSMSKKLACGDFFCQKSAEMFRQSRELPRTSHLFPQRSFFAQLLFHFVRDVILSMFRKLNKAERFTPGFICVLHPFGRSLQFVAVMGNSRPAHLIRGNHTSFFRRFVQGMDRGTAALFTDLADGELRF